MDVLLPFTPDLLCEPLIILRDSLQLSGSFMLPIMTKLALQAGHAVVLVAIAQGQAHYQQALRKVGVNMAAHMQSGQLAIVDALTNGHLLSEAELQAGAPALLSCIRAAVGVAQQQPDAATATLGSTPSGTDANSAAQPAAASGVNGFHNTPDGRSSTQRRLHGGQPTVNVLVDDLTAIGSLISDAHTWRSLLQQLLAITVAEELVNASGSGSNARQAGGPSGHEPIHGSVSLVALLHSDVEDAVAAEVLTSHAATVILDVDPLTAGQSADVSGRMRMQLQSCRAVVPWGSSDVDCERNFLVKASDRGIRFLQQYTAS